MIENYHNMNIIDQENDTMNHQSNGYIVLLILLRRSINKMGSLIIS